MGSCGSSRNRDNTRARRVELGDSGGSEKLNGAGGTDTRAGENLDAIAPGRLKMRDERGSLESCGGLTAGEQSVNAE
jgi:hypothetical protein